MRQKESEKKSRTKWKKKEIQRKGWPERERQNKKRQIDRHRETDTNRKKVTEA